MGMGYTKPHIMKVLGRWWCYTIDESGLPYWQSEGFGGSPEEAYEDWHQTHYTYHVQQGIE